MKKQIFFRNLALIAIVFATIVQLNSCQKMEISQTFDDTFNTANIENFNEVLQNAKTLSDMPGEFVENDLAMNDFAQNFEVTEYISSLEKSIKLSEVEVDLLLQNDVNTLVAVIDRISGVKQPEIPGEVFEGIENTSLNKYLLVQKQEVDAMYEDDYYTMIVEIQDYMRDFVIRPLKNYNTLVKNTELLKSANANDNKAKSNVVIVVFKNKKDMDDECEKKKDKEKEKKHKGSQGNNGNHYGQNK